MDQPVIFRWQEGAFVPSTPYQARLAAGRYTEGQLVPLVEHSQRSDRSHAHYFSVLHEQWLSLPEILAQEFPNEEVLRAHALIKTGYCNKRQLVCRSAKDAERVANFMRASTNAYAIIEVVGSVVTEWTAESQAYRAMGKERFLQSKDAVLGYVQSLLERAET